jgi:hypothetical protein
LRRNAADGSARIPWAGYRNTPALGNCGAIRHPALFSEADGSIPREMDRSNLEARAEGSGPHLGMLVLAAIVPFAVLGLMALPLGFTFLRQLAGF